MIYKQSYITHCFSCSLSQVTQPQKTLMREQRKHWNTARRMVTAQIIACWLTVAGTLAG